MKPFNKLTLVFLLLLCAAISACAEDISSKHYYDKAGHFYYDYDKNCKFQDFLKQQMNEADWSNVHKLKFVTKRNIVNDPNAPAPITEYTYEHDGLYIEFSKKPVTMPNWHDEYNLDVLRLSDKRLPAYFDKKFMLSTLAIDGMNEPVKNLSLSCDATATNIIFSDEEVDSISLEIDDGAAN